MRFDNRLDQPSSVHWHGVRLDNRLRRRAGRDAAAPCRPAARSTYRVHFRDAGIYWYHPHVREDIQQDLGLYGNILVAPSRGAWLARVDREEVLALDDLLLDDDGLLPYGADAPTHALMGRWGNVLLVNGEPRYALAARRGEVVRFYLTNVSNARIYNLSFGGRADEGRRLGRGKFERESWATSVVIAPAERYVVDVRFDRAGEIALTNRVQALDHMYGIYTPEVDTLGVVRVASGGSSTGAGAGFTRLRAQRGRHRRARTATGASRAVRQITRSFSTSEDAGPAAPVAMMLNSLNVPMDWNDGMPMANWVTTGREVRWILRDAETGRENMDIHWRFKRGSVVKLRIFNDPTSCPCHGPSDPPSRPAIPRPRAQRGGKPESRLEGHWPRSRRRNGRFSRRHGESGNLAPALSRRGAHGCGHDARLRRRLTRIARWTSKSTMSQHGGTDLPGFTLICCHSPASPPRTWWRTSAAESAAFARAIPRKNSTIS